MLLLQIAVPDIVTDESASQFFVNPGELCSMIWEQDILVDTYQVDSSMAASWLHLLCCWSIQCIGAAVT